MATMDIMALLRQKMQDPQFVDQLAQSSLDPAAFSSMAVPHGMEALYGGNGASPQQSRVPLEQRAGMQTGMSANPALALGAGMIQDAAQPQAPPVVMPATRVGAAPNAKVQQPLPTGLRSRGQPGLGELILGR